MEALGIDWTGIILALITLVGGCGWFVNWRKDRQEARGLKKDNEMKDMDLARKYVDEYNRRIVVPLQRRVDKMETQLDVLQDAFQGIYDCPLGSDCPVIDRLRRHS